MPFLRAAARFALLLPVLVAIVACKEELGGVQVKDLSFSGNRAVTTAQLKSVLATAESAWLPWGIKEYFTREEFEADLKRIVAYYRDRGYPDVRVRSFDARLSDDQKSVRLKVDIEEGEPIRVERVVFVGLEPLPEEHRRELETRLPLKAGQPLDRALLQSSREATIDELKDHGYPTPVVEFAETPGSSDRQRVVTYTAQPGRLAYVGRIEVQGTASVDPRIVRRQLTFRPGQLFEQSKLRESQRRLYSMELFNFVNIETSAAPSTDAGREGSRRQAPAPLLEPDARSHRHAGDGDRGQAPEGQFRARLRNGRESAWRDRLAPRELFRQRAYGGRLCALLGARPGRPAELPSTLLLRPEVFLRDERAIVVQRRACVQADDHWRARHDIARVIARALTTERPADDRIRVDLCERVGGIHHLGRGPERSHISRRPDCARSRSRDW